MSNAIHVQGQNTTTESSPHEEIKTFLKNYSAAWNSQDFWRLKDLWDLDDPMPFYKAMEVERPVIAEYYQRAFGIDLPDSAAPSL